MSVNLHNLTTTTLASFFSGGGVGIPATAILDETNAAILDENGGYILDES